MRNEQSNFTMLGASNHSQFEREVDDFYSTDPNALRLFLDEFLKTETIKSHVWECACGNGALSDVLKEYGFNVYSTDLINRGYGIGGADFFMYSNTNADIITNPPYNIAKEFVEHALDIQEEGCKTIMFLKIQFLEGQKRIDLFKKYPPKYIYVNSKRQVCFPNGDTTRKVSSAMCYCWFVWEKGFKGEPVIRWL